MGNFAVAMAYRYAECLQGAYDGIMANAVTFGEDNDFAIERYYDDLSSRLQEDEDVSDALLSDINEGIMPEDVMSVLNDIIESEDKHREIPEISGADELEQLYPAPHDFDPDFSL